MTDYYPGSKTPKKQYPGTPAQLPASPPEIGDPFRLVRYRGWVIEGYTLGQLARMLGRKPVTIRRWESEGVIPAAPFELPGAGGDDRGKRRLYSREHMEGILEIATEEGVLSTTCKISETDFTTRIVALFEELHREFNDNPQKR